MMQRRYILVVVLLSAHFIAVSTAAAQDSLSPDIDDGIFAYFGTEYGDIRSAELINQIFGPLCPAVDGGAAANPFSTLIGFINLALLAVGGLLLTYNIVAGLLQTAHEGEFLGRL